LGRKIPKFLLNLSFLGGLRHFSASKVPYGGFFRNFPHIFPVKKILFMWSGRLSPLNLRKQEISVLPKEIQKQKCKKVVAVESTLF